MQLQPKIRYSSQVAILAGLIGVSFIIASFAAAGFWRVFTGKSIFTMQEDMANPAFANAARWTQLIAAAIMFFIPAIIYARIVNPNPFQQLGFNSVISGKQFFLVLLIALCGMALSGSLGTLNEMIPISKEWAAKFKNAEDAYNKQVLIIAKMNSFKEYLFAMVVIALAPAIFEEVLFRGALQRLFQHWFKNISVAIVVTSIIFSIVHFSYYGFLARAGLGIILGLIFYYSRNIWLCIWAHFINNGLAVTALYVLGLQGKNPETALKDNFPIIYGAAALIIIIFLLLTFKKESNSIGANEIYDGSLEKLKSNNPFE
ncbi:MAG TPA: CPBP family intramembrane metalloprotease [Chitinophagaceae bacterium]|nr:CPBP family intramembrane metalloprotease [Chitinophagaceae bacterium]HNL83099.1 CPBP family intramembrane metalloprotease [Chitinophagaceae bacterium]